MNTENITPHQQAIIDKAINCGAKIEGGKISFSLSELETFNSRIIKKSVAKVDLPEPIRSILLATATGDCC